MYAKMDEISVWHEVFSIYLPLGVLGPRESGKVFHEPRLLSTALFYARPYQSVTRYRRIRMRSNLDMPDTANPRWSGPDSGRHSNNPPQRCLYFWHHRNAMVAIKMRNRITLILYYSAQGFDKR